MLASTEAKRIVSGFCWAEGPAWFGDMRVLLWNDIPNNAVTHQDEISGETDVSRYSANYSNGRVRDRQGRLVSCGYGTRRITRTGYDRSVTVLADSYQGKRLNSLNDIVMELDGIIRFTDPPFGINGFYEGHKATPELPQSIYCPEPESRKLSAVLGDVKGPNDLCFLPDEKTLYVMESRAMPNRLILAWDVEGDTLKNKRVYLDCNNGAADGITCNVDGNL